MPSDQFHRIEKLVGNCEDWQSVTFENSWVDFNSATHATAQYYKDQFNIVHLKGVVKNGSGIPSTIFTLPADYRPDDGIVHSFAVVSVGAFGEVYINASGEVICQVGSTSAVTLDGISWRA